jgi:hypothetical protein
MSLRCEWGVWNPPTCTNDHTGTEIDLRRLLLQFIGIGAIGGIGIILTNRKR